MLSTQAIRLIYAEVNFARLYEGQAFFDDVWHLLERYNYRLFGLYNLTAGADYFLGYGDAIFLASDFDVPEMQLFD